MKCPVCGREMNGTDKTGSPWWQCEQDKGTSTWWLNEWFNGRACTNKPLPKVVSGQTFTSEFSRLNENQLKRMAQMTQGIVTGRFSSVGPNLDSIPKDHVCSCELFAMMRVGCTCGGI